MVLMEGKQIASEIQQELKVAIARQTGRPPCLAVILIGEHPASQIYVTRKVKACSEVGILSIRKQLAADIPEDALLKEIAMLNDDPTVDGILVQFPLPSHIKPSVITQAIKPEKDVDGFHPTNVGKMLTGEDGGFKPCTPLGIKVMLERYGIDVAGRHALVFGRSNIVGKPMAALLMQSMPGGNATVTIAHSQSQNIAELSRMADIIIAAVGKPGLITADMVKEGAIVVDVGINKVADSSTKAGYRLVGDVDFASVAPKCSFITPVPGGVGPMTIAMLLSNTFESYLRRHGKTY